MDSCIICYENNNLIIPKNCKCKITFHENCLDKMKKSLNIDCPMCRNKIMIFNKSETNTRNYNLNYNENRIHPIIYFIYIITLLLLIIFILIIFGLIIKIFNFFSPTLFKIFSFKYYNIL